jgi:3',5'-cyclic AMP phosphodiesterase CpdA
LRPLVASDPIQLAKVGIRSVISKAIGSYADQRPIQAAMDWAEEEGLLLRHDYSEVDHELHIATHPKRADQGKVERKEATKPHVNLDENNSLWVDFIADLGDGFEATYAMAYLLAKSKLKVAGVTSEEWPNGLPAGEFLIFGGDLAYPDATVGEYNARCIAPYEAAFHAEKPKRKLFFISGNHDWYDGLAAFTSVFCGARDRLSHCCNARG